MQNLEMPLRSSVRHGTPHLVASFRLCLLLPATRLQRTDQIDNLLRLQHNQQLYIYMQRVIGSLAGSHCQNPSFSSAQLPNSRKGGVIMPLMMHLDAMIGSR